MRSLKLNLDVARNLCISSIISPSAPAPAEVDARPNSVAFSEDGLALYSASNDGVITVVDVPSGARRSEFFVRGAGCRHVTATRHAAGVLHAADASGAISYHNLHENKIVRVFRGHAGRITSLSMSPATEHFLSVGADGTFRVWDLRAAAPVGQGRIDLPPPPPPGPGADAKAPTAAGAFDAGGQVFCIALPQRGLAMYNARNLALPVEEFSPLPFEVLRAPLFRFTSYPQVRCARVPRRGAHVLSSYPVPTPRTRSLDSACPRWPRRTSCRRRTR